MPAIRKAVLDTNVLLLFFAARIDVRILQEFKRVQMFTREDIDALSDILRRFPDLVTTPHILTETSNFINQAPIWRRDALVAELCNFIQETAEIYRPAEILSGRDEFNAFGLSDTGLAELSSEAIVVTVDFALSGKIEELGGNVVNFNHYRSTYLLMT